ncbi:MAG: hypothetical protein KatS3mg102_0495 [Planctomycetota bacterium]|nr:MAG: hypothetical protein KatS3mg102_0495 [Planctomycetota bacterium]
MSGAASWTELERQARGAAAPYRLVLPSGPVGGGAGEFAGLGAGASLELLELRDYVPGDDLRHLDWRAYARSDRLQTRLYRAEVAPWVELICDCSASMAVSARKERAARALLAALLWCSRAAGGRPRLLACGKGPLAATSPPAFGGPDPLELVPAVPLRPRGVRVLLSDLLHRADPAPRLARLAAGAAQLVVIQLLDPWELAPEATGPLELVDCESGERLELELVPETVADYQRRLQRLRAEAERAVRAVGGRYACVSAAEPAAMLATLMRAGILEPLP